MAKNPLKMVYPQTAKASSRTRAKESSLITTVERRRLPAIMDAACSKEANMLVLPQASGISKIQDHLELIDKDVMMGLSNAS